jgi:hypothetical protein
VADETITQSLQMAQDGYKPGLLTEGHKPQSVSIPANVQGGYQTSGGGKPTPPTTGSGVTSPAPANK